MSTIPKTPQARPATAEQMETCRTVLEGAYYADIAELTQTAHHQLLAAGHTPLDQDAARDVVAGVVRESVRVRNVGAALEALTYSGWDAAVWDFHEPDCGCLDWTTPTVWCHLALYAVLYDVLDQLAEQHEFDVRYNRGDAAVGDRERPTEPNWGFARVEPGTTC